MLEIGGERDSQADRETETERDRDRDTKIFIDRCIARDRQTELDR